MLRQGLDYPVAYRSDRLAARKHVEAHPLEVIGERWIAAGHDEQAIDERRRRDRLQRFAQNAEAALGIGALLLEVRQGDRDGVLTELVLYADRAGALVGQAVFTDPDPDGVGGAAGLGGFDATAKLASTGGHVLNALLGEAAFASLEHVSADDDRDGVAVQDVRDSPLHAPNSTGVSEGLHEWERRPI